LHHVEPAQARGEHEVAAFAEVTGVQRVERELGRVGVARLKVASIDRAQDAGQAPEIFRIGRRDESTSLVARGNPWAATANPPIRT
jgi:hypothetical protein